MGVATMGSMSGGRARSVAARLSVMAAAAMVAQGCAGDGDQGPLCPRAAILGEAQQMTRFAPSGGRQPRDIDFEAEISDLDSGCRLDRDRDGRDVLVVAVAPVITTTQGPANRTGRANFFYFVSLIAPDRSIVTRETFSSEARFAADQRRVVQREDDPPVTIDIPLQRAVAAADYEIIIGLQIAPDELEYNRRRAGGGR